MGWSDSVSNGKRCFLEVINGCSILTEIIESLDVSFNNITGSIPSAVWGFQSLEQLNLAQNSLRGSIAADVGQLTTLKELSLQNNVITGSIPPQIGALTSVGMS